MFACLLILLLGFVFSSQVWGKFAVGDVIKFINPFLFLRSEMALRHLLYGGILLAGLTVAGCSEADKRLAAYPHGEPDVEEPTPSGDDDDSASCDPCEEPTPGQHADALEQKVDAFFGRLKVTKATVPYALSQDVSTKERLDAYRETFGVDYDSFVQQVAVNVAQAQSNQQQLLLMAEPIGIALNVGAGFTGGDPLMAFREDVLKQFYFEAEALVGLEQYHIARPFIDLGRSVALRWNLDEKPHEQKVLDVILQRAETLLDHNKPSKVKPLLEGHAKELAVYNLFDLSANYRGMQTTAYRKALEQVERGNYVAAQSFTELGDYFANEHRLGGARSQAERVMEEAYINATGRAEASEYELAKPPVEFAWKQAEKYGLDTHPLVEPVIAAAYAEVETHHNASRDDLAQRALTFGREVAESHGLDAKVAEFDALIPHVHP